MRKRQELHLIIGLESIDSTNNIFFKKITLKCLSGPSFPPPRAHPRLPLFGQAKRKSRKSDRGGQKIRSHRLRVDIAYRVKRTAVRQEFFFPKMKLLKRVFPHIFLHSEISTLFASFFAKQRGPSVVQYT